MHDLEISWPAGRARFTPDNSPVAVGRSPDAAVPLSEPSVSRQHIEFVWNDVAWLARDSSTHGSFDPIGVRLAPEWTVGTDTVIRLGGAEGVELQISLVTTRPLVAMDPIAPPQAPAPVPPGPPSLDDFSAPAPPGRPAPVAAPAPPPSAFDQAPPPAPGPYAGDGSDGTEAWGGGGDDGWSEPAATSVQHLASATVVSDATIQIAVDGRDYTFLPGTEITVGRDPSCLVKVDERHSLVSRRHLTISHRDDAWWIEDSSTKGTFVDGRRISGPVKAQGAFLTQLGDDDAGVSMRVITAGEHRARPQRNIPLLLAIAVLAVIAIGALALALTNLGGGDTDTDTNAQAPATSTGGASTLSERSAANLAVAKQATVLLLAEEGVGSGFFVGDNLILTNQHVAELATTLLVAVSREADRPALVEYEAETVDQHPFLDIALLRLTVDLSGQPVDSSGLPSTTIGSSSEIALGDPVYNTGFPSTLSLISLDDMGDLRLPPVSTTRGEAASFSIWPGCSNPDQAAFIPLGSPAGVTCAASGDVDNGVVITTFASGQGASGSPVFRGDEVVAVVFAGPADEANASRNITTDAFREWLDEALAEHG